MTARETAAPLSLVVLTDIDRDDEAAFNDWYDREHMRDRVRAVPGYLRGRRFVARGDGPKYLAIYDLQQGVLESAAYRAIVRNPDQKSQYFIPRLRNASRAVMRQIAQYGEGEGSLIALANFAVEPNRATDFAAAVERDLMPQLNVLQGVIAMTLLKAEPSDPAQGGVATLKKVERRMDWLLIIDSGASVALAAATERIDAWLATTSLAAAQHSQFTMIYRISPAVPA